MAILYLTSGRVLDVVESFDVIMRTINKVPHDVAWPVLALIEASTSTKTSAKIGVSLRHIEWLE